MNILLGIIFKILLDYQNVFLYNSGEPLKMFQDLKDVMPQPVKEVVETAQDGVPVATIIMFAAGNPPSAAWRNCDGDEVSRVDYALLFFMIGITYGAGNGSTTFNLPDFRGVFPKGSGMTSRLLGKDAMGNFYEGVGGQYLQDKMQGHIHLIQRMDVGATPGKFLSDVCGAALGTVLSFGPYTDTVNGVPRTGLTTEPQSLCVNFMIKVLPGEAPVSRILRV